MDYASCGTGDTCDFYFKPLAIRDEDGNTLKNIPKTASTSNTNKVNLTLVTELKSLIEITVPTNKTVNIFTSVWDADGGAYGDDDWIREVTNFEIPFETMSANQDWEQETQSKSKMQFTVIYKLLSCTVNFTGVGCNFCERDQYTDQCNVYCKQYLNYYTCDPTTGGKICVAGKKGDNCDECENGKMGQDCDRCKSNFIGDDCDKCAEGFYPDGICDVNCIPDEENYTCTDEGEKQCRGNRDGEECDECKPNFYKEDCSIICEENEFYNCTEDGEKVCYNSTAKLEDNCGRPDEDEKKDKEDEEIRASNNTLIIGITGGGGLLLFLVILVITLIIRKQRRQREEKPNTEDGNVVNPDNDPGALYSTVNKPPLYSTVNKQRLSAEDQDVYSRLERPGYCNKPQQPSSEVAEDGEMYADVAFVKNRGKDDVVMFRNPCAEKVGDDATYITVTGLN